MPEIQKHTAIRLMRLLHNAVDFSLPCFPVYPIRGLTGILLLIILFPNSPAPSASADLVKISPCPKCPENGEFRALYTIFQIHLRHLLAPFPLWRPVVPFSVALLRCISLPLARTKNSRNILVHSHLEIVLDFTKNALEF